MELIEYFGITANDIFPNPSAESRPSREKSAYLREIQGLLEQCSDNQLAVVRNLLQEMVPFLKE